MAARFNKTHSLERTFESAADSPLSRPNPTTGTHTHTHTHSRKPIEPIKSNAPLQFAIFFFLSQARRARNAGQFARLKQVSL